MQITVKDKKQELNFGLGFLKELDKLNPFTQEGVQIGLGFSKTYGGVVGGDIGAFATMIYAATHNNSPRASLDDVFDWVTSLKEDEFVKFSDEFKANLKKLNKMTEALRE